MERRAKDSSDEVLDAQTRYKQAMADLTLNKGMAEHLRTQVGALAELPEKLSLLKGNLALKEGIIKNQGAQLEDQAKQLAELRGKLDGLPAGSAGLIEQREAAKAENAKLRQELESMQQRLAKQGDDGRAAADQLRAQTKQTQDALADANRQIAALNRELAAAKFNRQRWERFCKFYKLATRDRLQLTTSDLTDIFGAPAEVTTDLGKTVWIYRDEAGNEYRVTLQEGPDNRKSIAGMLPLP